MSTRDSNTSAVTIRTLFAALADFQQQQTEFAQQQKEVSQKIEFCLRELGKHFAVDLPAGVAGSESPADSIQTAPTEQAASQGLATGDIGSETKTPRMASPYKTVSPYKTLEQESPRQSSQQSVEDSSADGQKIDPPKKRASLYQTLETTSETSAKPIPATYTPAKPSDRPGQPSAKSALPSAKTNELPRKGMGETVTNRAAANSAAGNRAAGKSAVESAAIENKKKQNLIDEASAEVKKQEASRDAAAGIEELLPTVDQFTNQLIEASDQQLKEVFRPNKSGDNDPNTLDVVDVNAVDPVHDLENDGPALTSVQDAIAMEVTDERSLLDQIHRFTETLSESSNFWKQVTIPRADQEPAAAKSVDPTASIAAQYENSSRSPYSH